MFMHLIRLVGEEGLVFVLISSAINFSHSQESDCAAE